MCSQSLITTGGGGDFISIVPPGINSMKRALLMWHNVIISECGDQWIIRTFQAPRAARQLPETRQPPVHAAAEPDL